MKYSEITHFGVFSGSGIGAAGMQQAQPEIPGLRGRMVCLGGIDVDPAGAADFQRFTGVRCTVRDPVSYTHLDVYKRQPHHGGRRLGLQPFITKFGQVRSPYPIHRTDT